MMASSRKISAGLGLFCVFCFSNLSVMAGSSATTEPEARRFSLRELFGPRVKRQKCADGNYDHEGRTCCLCAAGQRLKEHCTTTPDDRKCELCVVGSTYNSEPNSKSNCEICKRCNHDNANLEVEEQCTPYKDTKCRCKKGHYCTDSTGVCKICQPCETCEFTGVKEPCSATSNAVCNEESKGLGGGAIAGIVIAVLILVAAAVVAVVFRKRIWELFTSRSGSSSPPNNDDPLLPVDMQNHLQDVAEILGWKNMRSIALSSQMPMNVIESVQLSYPNDCEMWTIEILRKWVDRKGRTASVELIRILRKRNQNIRANKIIEKLNESEPSRTN